MQERLYLFPYEWKTIFFLLVTFCYKDCFDARQLSLNTNVIVDGCRGIELEPGDIDRALDEMKRAAAVLLKSSDL
jgi:nicotinamidase/pyrazinamidase